MKFKVDPGWIVVLMLAAMGGAWWLWGERGGQGGGGGGEMVKAALPDRTLYCTSVSGTPVERLHACLSALPEVSLSGQAAERISDIGEKGKVFVVGKRLPSSVAQLNLSSKPELEAPLLATDEEAAAKALREAGVRGFVIHRDITQALDRDKVVLSRLAHHDHLEWFQLRYVTKDSLVYTVRRASSRMPLGTGERLLASLRARLEGTPRPKMSESWNPNSVRLMASARLQGETLVLRHVYKTDVDRALDDLAAKMAKRWEREVATQGMGSLAERMADLRLEIHVVMEKADVEPRSSYAIFDLWEMGVDGMMFKHHKGVKDEKFTYMPGSELIVHSMKSVDTFFRDAVKQFGWRDTRPWHDSSTHLYITRDQHFMEAEPGGGAAIRMIRGMPEVPMSDLSDSTIRQMLVDGGEWWLNNQRADGSFNYKYWPAQNRLSNDYNEVRHILATRDLADTWRYRHDPRYLEGAEQAMKWLLKYQIHDTYPKDDTLPHPPAKSMLFRYPLNNQEVPGKPANQKLGTVAVALLGWVAWASATGDHSQDDNIRKQAEFVLSQVESNGKFTAYYVNKTHSYYNNKNDIVPGEAALALGMVAEYFDEPEWLEFFPKFLDYYEPWFRTRADRKNPYGRWPHHTYDNNTRLDLVQFGPWSVMANKQYYMITGDERGARFGLEVADWMIDNYQWSEERSPFPDYVGGYYKIPSELPAMQTFCYSEGTAAAYHIASKLDPGVKDKYDRSTREAIRFLKVMQFDDHSGYFAAEPELIHGGIKYAMNEQKIRIDYVGHGLSTLSQYLDARAFDPRVELGVTPQQVEYTKAHRDLWGNWALDNMVLAMPQELSEAQQKQLNERFTRVARNSRYRYTPDTIVEVSMGRARRLTYEVVESEGNQLTIEIMRPSGQPRTEVLQVSGDTLIATDERGERRYRRMRSPRVTAEKESEKEIEESGSR